MRAALLFSTLLFSVAQAVTVRIGDEDVILPGQPILPSQPTEWLDGVEVTLPGRPISAVSIPLELVNEISSTGYFAPHADRLGPLKRAPSPDKFYGDGGVPLISHPRQNQSVPSCGLTAAMQSVARIFPELLTKNIIVDNANSVKVSITDYRVTPRVKKTIIVNKSSLNSTNMMASSVWWPGALEKGVEGIGSSTIYLLASWAMTMITGLEAEAKMTELTGLPNKLTRDATWAELVKCKTTPITIQTWGASRVTGKLQENHVFTVLNAEFSRGTKRLTLLNPHGFEDNVTFEEVWKQFYIISWLKGQPTRQSLGMAPATWL